MGLMLLFMFLTITVTEGVKDWRKSPHQMYIPTCKLHPKMSSYMMPGEELFSFNKVEQNLTRNQGVWSIRECHVPKIRDTSLVEVHHKRALAREDVLHQHADSGGPRVGCVLQDQPSIIGYNGFLQDVDITQAGPRARCVRRAQQGTKDYDGVPQHVAIIRAAILDPG